MTIIYRTNGEETAKALTELYFGEAFVREQTETAVQIREIFGRNCWKVFHPSAGFLTIEIL